MNKMLYQVVMGSDLLAKFASAIDAQIFADALDSALEQHEAIKVETSKEVIYRIAEVV